VETKIKADTSTAHLKKHRLLAAGRTAEISGERGVRQELS
jgi:hypothetical protein